VITARLEQRRGAVARCVLELIVICVYVCLTQAHRHLHHNPKSISSFSPSSQSTKVVCLTRRDDNIYKIIPFCLNMFIDQVNERVTALIQFFLEQDNGIYTER
jgi:hypothetical protein